MVIVVYVGGSRIVPWILVQVARMRSRELFTLTVLACFRSRRRRLRAFRASMAPGRSWRGCSSPSRRSASRQAPTMLLRCDAFAVLFFVAVGMLFDPTFVLQRFDLLAAGLAIVPRRRWRHWRSSRYPG